MSMDSKISQFQEWANRIGCPPQYIPRKVAIGRKWHCSIDTMMARVNPLDAANAARSKILIKSINHVESRHGVSTHHQTIICKSTFRTARHPTRLLQKIVQPSSYDTKKFKNYVAAYLASKKNWLKNKKSSRVYRFPTMKQVR